MEDLFEQESDSKLKDRCLRIEVTTHCNSTCRHCFARAAISEYSALPVDLVYEIVNEGRDCGYDQLHLTGGEPFLWDGLFEILKYAGDAGYKDIFLNSNGTLLAESVVERLAAFSNLAISVSLEGPEALHDRIRGRDSYRKALQGIQTTIEACIPLSIFTAARKSLLPIFPRFAEYVFKDLKGIRNLTLIQLIRVTDDYVDLSDEVLEPHDFINLVRMMALLNRYGLRTKILNNPLANIVAKLLEVPWIPESQPLYREGSIFVMANRDVTLSHSSRKSFGRYRPGMIKNTLASESYRNALAPDREICPACRYYNLCMNNSMFRPSKWYRDMNSTEPYCLRVLEMTEMML